MIRKKPPLIAHVIYRLHIGGLENGLVNLINEMPGDSFSHVIICLTDYTDFRLRLNKDIPCYALHKKPGNDIALFYHLWRLLRRLQPDIVHTRNINTLESQLMAWLSGVSHRVHGEHGRNMQDIDGSNQRYLMLRRLFRLLVQRYIVLSQEMQHWILRDVKADPAKVTQIYNGVDTQKFTPASISGFRMAAIPEFIRAKPYLIGTVGRMDPEKDQLTLVKAYIDFAQRVPQLQQQTALILVGEGSLKDPAWTLLQQQGLDRYAWLPGARQDVAEILRSLDLFVLPSLGEGISNTILEAMASGVPVLATDVGGNRELVVTGETGTIIPANQAGLMSQSIEHYIRQPELLREQGKNARTRTVTHFSLHKMVENYLQFYRAVMA